MRLLPKPKLRQFLSFFSSKMNQQETENEILKLKLEIKNKKSTQKPIDDLVLKLTNLKASLKVDKFDRQPLEALLTKRFFYSPSFAIYGGIAGLYDYGPPGCALQNNILSQWRSHFVLEENMLEIECTNLTPESVLKTSGHVDRFADYMVKDIKTGDIFRADHLVKAVLTSRIEDDRNLRLGTADVKKPKGVKPAEQISPELKQEYETILETVF